MEGYKMSLSLFDDFLTSQDSLRVYDGDELVFKSSKDRLQPLLEYIDGFADHSGKVKIYDRIAGNAAALLSIKAGCQILYSPLGSEIAIHTLHDYHIKYHVTKVVPYIQRVDQQGMCPMEELSMGKSPEEFYQILRQRAAGR